jgi:hypothetical protein
VTPAPQALGADPAVEAELGWLPTTPIADLRKRYCELFRAEPPKAFGPDLLRRSIAHRIQEKAYGGLSRPVQRLLDQMIKAFAAKPGGRIVLPRRIKPGSVLVRQWKGKSHRVTVLADGFDYGGKAFGNLSEIAVLITGTRWNGPRFFGLRTKPQERDEPGVTGQPGNAGRKGAESVRSGRPYSGNDHRKAGHGRPSTLESGRHGR